MVFDPLRDPVIGAIYNGIVKDIKSAFDNGALRGGLVLLYSGIDSMAFLNMPDGQSDVTRSDFMIWVRKYMQFDDSSDLRPLDLYSARCALLHTYGVESALTRSGAARIVGYMDKGDPPIRYQPSVDPNFVIISLEELKTRFFTGVDKSVIDLHASRDRSVIEARLRKLIAVLPFTRSDHAELGSMHSP